MAEMGGCEFGLVFTSQFFILLMDELTKSQIEGFSAVLKGGIFMQRKAEFRMVI
jgi:hypothetical protein